METQEVTDREELEPVEHEGMSMILGTDLELPSPEQVDRQVARYNGVLRAVLKLTHAQDWVGFSTTDGRKVFRLDGFGARRMMKPLGVSVSAVTREKMSMEDEKGKFYMWIYSGIARMGSGEVYVEGRASSRDKFFAINYGELRPLSEVSQKDIMTAAYNDLLKKAVTTPLGLGNYTEEDLRELGFDTSKLRGYEFKSGSGGKAGAPKASSSDPSESQLNEIERLKIKLGWGTEKIEELILSYTGQRKNTPDKLTKAEAIKVVGALGTLVKAKDNLQGQEGGEGVSG